MSHDIIDHELSIVLQHLHSVTDHRIRLRICPNTDCALSYIEIDGSYTELYRALYSVIFQAAFRKKKKYSLICLTVKIMVSFFTKVSLPMFFSLLCGIGIKKKTFMNFFYVDCVNVCKMSLGHLN